MPLPKIYTFLIETHFFDSEEGRLSIFGQAGFDTALVGQIVIGGATLNFLIGCLQRVYRYGTLRNGQNAFRALMSAVQQRVGQGEGPAIERLFSEWERMEAIRTIDGFATLVRDDQSLLAAALRFQVIFETARRQAAVVSKYKEIHDQLDDLQTLCYERLVAETAHFLDDFAARNHLVDPSRRLRRIVDNLKENSQGIGTEIEWIGDLDLLRARLDDALSRADLRPLDEIKQDLRDILETEPTDINRRLVDAAASLRLPDLIRAIEFVVRNRDEDDNRRIAQFEAGLHALGNLDRRLAVLIDEHNKWQDVDRRLRLIDADLAKNVDQLEKSWRLLKSRVERLCSDGRQWAADIGSTESWAAEITNDITALQDAIDGRDPDKERLIFRGFRDRASDRFFRVDKALKQLCTEELRPIGERLDGLLEAMP